VAGFYEQVNEPSGFIKKEGFSDKLSDNQRHSALQIISCTME